ncbi:putative transcription elongation factor Spt5, NGN domain-containing protein [Medicago truncatula]|uniref:Putative transcription elongation factor Spt5, NGN domain-containing protein n=1 Tax=Medicago truncatula TaxID=3880 RepID=A0A396JK57_MEDTR|nr:putative transcription elongation factor Spt5, NGN domain-containing protein [Medicago truncatula]
MERRIHERYGKQRLAEEYDEETTDVEQQSLLPSVRDPKLWMVKCVIGRERESAVCLMQKYINKGSDLQIRSAIALDHLKNYIYVEADKEAHVREAIDLARDTWIRMKIGTYKGDLAKVCTVFLDIHHSIPILNLSPNLYPFQQVVNVDNVRQKVTVKLIPRIDLQALANKLEGREVVKKKTFGSSS